MGKRVAAAVLLFGLLCAVASVEGEESFSEEIDSLGLHFRWDPFLETGTLQRGSRSLSFVLGGSLLLVDGKTVQAGEVKRNTDGALMGDSSFFSTLRLLFPPPSEAPISVTTIIIDPGHGGRDPGAVGRHQIDGAPYVLYEKDVVLKVSKELHRRLSASYPDKKIILTRAEDHYLTLEERTETANRIELNDNEVMVFVSIHANASLNSRAAGFEVWYLPPDYRRELIDPESIDPEYRDVAPILNTMLEEEFTVESILLARSVSEEIGKVVGGISENRGLKEESWFVVRNARMPSVLVELGFVTNADEVQLLGDSRYLMKLTEGIYNGLARFINRFEE